MFNCSIYSFTLSLGLKVLTHGPHIEGGAVDPKIKRRDLCFTFTKACEKFQKFNKFMRLYVTFGEHKEKNPNKPILRKVLKKKCYLKANFKVK